MNLECDYLVVGSGVSGMTMSLLLADAGYRVVLIEKAKRIGGSMQRFRRNGVPFDTGFHFTAGLDDCMSQMLQLLKIRSEITFEPVETEIFFADTGHRFPIPHGHDAVCAELVAGFPENTAQIRAYFERESLIFQTTPLFDLASGRSLFDMMPGPEDEMSLSMYLDSLGIEQGELRAILESFATCHGTPPDEISLANHARISYGLFDNMVRLHRGGDAFISAFSRRAKELNIQILTDCTIAELTDFTGKSAHGATLTDGSHVSFSSCVLTIHPQEILSMLPADMVSADFRARVNEFHETCGFFTLFATLDLPADQVHTRLVSRFSSNSIFDMVTGHNGESATGIMITSEPDSTGKLCGTLTAFSSVPRTETAAWESSRIGARPSSYLEYKQRKTDELLAGVYEACPELKGHVTCAESASMLTFRDYLSPFGSAYGVRKKYTEFSLFGRLPVRNFYAAGQNALLPGAMGAMLSSFVLFRKFIGEETYLSWIRTLNGGIPA